MSILHESQLFQADAFDLQSLLLLFNLQEEIPHNELVFLLHDEHDWYHVLQLPDSMTVSRSTKE